MGIRYFAQPIQSDDIEIARADPHAYLRTDRHHQFSRHHEPRPPYLDLDKAWRPLQGLFDSSPGTARRPAAALVAGGVTQRCCGWRPHLQVLDPETVRAIADDLERPEWDEVTAHAAADCYDDLSYVGEMLHRAQVFTRTLATQGWGMYYEIG